MSLSTHCRCLGIKKSNCLLSFLPSACGGFCLKLPCFMRVSLLKTGLLRKHWLLHCATMWKSLGRSPRNVWAIFQSSCTWMLWEPWLLQAQLAVAKKNDHNLAVLGVATSWSIKVQIKECGSSCLAFVFFGQVGCNLTGQFYPNLPLSDFFRTTFCVIATQFAIGR